MIECEDYHIGVINDTRPLLRIEFNKKEDISNIIDTLKQSLEQETKSEVKVNFKPGTKISRETGYPEKSFFEGGRYPGYGVFVPKYGIKGEVHCVSRWGETGLTIHLRQSRPALDTPRFDCEKFLGQYAERTFTQTN